MSAGNARFRVVDPAEAGRRQEAVAMDRYRRAAAEADRVARLIASARAVFGFGNVEFPSVVPLPRGASAVEARAAAAATDAATARARDRYEQAIARARAQAMTARIDGVRFHRLADDAEAERAARIAARRSGGDTDRRRPGREVGLAAEIERLVARLPGDLDHAEAQPVADAVASALAAPASADPGWSLDLVRMAIQQAGDRAAERRHRRDQVLRLLELLDGLDGPAAAGGAAVTALRDRLADVAPGAPLPAGIAAEVRAVATAAQAARDRAFALSALAGALSDLGYEVDGRFDADASSTGALVAMPESDEHGVRVRDVGGRLDFDVVRFAAPDDRGDTVADGRAEARWCSVYDGLVDAMARRGVLLHVEEQRPPGERPLDRVDKRVDRRTAKTRQVNRERRR